MSIFCATNFRFLRFRSPSLDCLDRISFREYRYEHRNHKAVDSSHTPYQWSLLPHSETFEISETSEINDGDVIKPSLEKKPKARLSALSPYSFFGKLRFEHGGYEALESFASHAPKNPNRIDEAIEGRVIHLRQQHPKWGKRRIADEIAKPAAMRVKTDRWSSRLSWMTRLIGEGRTK